MRTPIVAANWKMHMEVREALDFAEILAARLDQIDGVEVVLAPPFTALEPLHQATGGTALALAGQNVHAEPRGAFTGEISAAMLADVGCRYVIVGHSERRRDFGETDAQVAHKAAAALEHGLHPIVCVGESLADREADRALEVVGRQVEASLAGLPTERAEELVLAYEPVWAIGTGRTATPEIAQQVHAEIRARLGARFGEGARRIRIQYGGSVKPDNAFDLMAQPDIDGALVGGASLDPESFWAIIRFDRAPEGP